MDDEDTDKYETFAKNWAHAEDRARDLLENGGTTLGDYQAFVEWIIVANASMCAGRSLGGANCFTCRVGAERDAFRAALAACGGKLDREAGTEPIPSQQQVRIRYTNHRGETAVRTIIPARLEFAANVWHQTPQWLLHAWDVEKDAARTFALKDVLAWGIKDEG